MNKKLSIILTVKNRTNILCNYDSIQLKTFERHNIFTSGFKDDLYKVKNNINLRLLLRCLESLENVKDTFEEFEVIIVDFGSDDFNMSTLASLYPKLKIKLITLNDYFSRGKGLNIGFDNSTNDNLFFCDTDMLFKTRDIFDIAYHHMKNGKAYFPICFDLCDPTHQIGYWRTSGYGMMFINKKLYNNYKWSEYNSLGKEDNDIWSVFKENSVRERVKGYYHQWHPPTLEFKNKYYKHNRIDIPKIYFDLIHTNLDHIKKSFVDLNIYTTTNLEFKVTHCIVNNYKALYSAIDYKNQFNKKLIIYMLFNLKDISIEEHNILQEILVKCPNLKNKITIINSLQDVIKFFQK